MVPQGARAEKAIKLLQDLEHHGMQETINRGVIPAMIVHNMNHDVDDDIYPGGGH